MNKIILCAVIWLLSFETFAQRLEYIDINKEKYVVLYAYGLPRKTVKTNTELKNSKISTGKTNNIGIVRRHYIDAKGHIQGIGTGGYPVNEKLSLAFAIAPENVDETGRQTNKKEPMTWLIASGWKADLLKTDPLSEDSSGEFIAETPTGCAAYQGKNKEDPPGTWRLPTQREAMMMFLFMHEALSITSEYTLIHGNYWTATEIETTVRWQYWFLSTTSGHTQNEKYDHPNVMTRCIKDIIPSDNI